MLIFGTEKIYASHLPLFHSPHNYQIILELQLDDAAKQQFISDQQQHPEAATYTIEPEKFILPQMIATPKPYTANIYRGHFERGGIKIMENITVQIKQVVYFKKFNVDESKEAAADFILFGNSKEQFAVHHISNKPDFEQIIQVTANNPLSSADKFIIITINPAANTPIGVSGNTIEATNNNTAIQLTLLKQLYLEFDDLKE